MSEKDRSESLQNAYTDSLFLSPSESTHMQLTPTLFDGSNFLTWSRAVKLGLGAKNKIKFIDGSLKCPEVTHKDYARWIQNDHMVRCWLFRSMKDDIAVGFILVESAQQLWEELQERYSQNNAPLLFQLKRDASSIEQGDLSVSEYYGRLKKVWDDIAEIEVLPKCECGGIKECSCELTKKMFEREERSRIIDFLMKLDPKKYGIRGQILAMDPLPSINKVFQSVCQGEREKQVTGAINLFQESASFNINKQNSQLQQGSCMRKENKKAKFEKRCDFCGV